MIVIAAVDDNNGMMFNKRRQSKDSVLRKRILSIAGGGKLWMNDYTYRQFLDCDAAGICVNENFYDKAGLGEYCLIENVSAASRAEGIEKIILFRWNRKYPSDFYFDIDLNGCGWKLSETREFAGSSHESITEEVYTRE